MNRKPTRRINLMSNPFYQWQLLGTSPTPPKSQHQSGTKYYGHPQSCPGESQILHARGIARTDTAITGVIYLWQVCAHVEPFSIIVVVYEKQSNARKQFFLRSMTKLAQLSKPHMLPLVKPNEINLPC